MLSQAVFTFQFVSKRKFYNKIKTTVSVVCVRGALVSNCFQATTRLKSESKSIARVGMTRTHCTLTRKSQDLTYSRQEDFSLGLSLSPHWFCRDVVNRVIRPRNRPVDSFLKKSQSHRDPGKEWTVCPQLFWHHRTSNESVSGELLLIFHESCSNKTVAAFTDHSVLHQVIPVRARCR